MNQSLLLNESSDSLKASFYALKTPADVAQILDVDYGRLAYHLFRVPEEEKYTIFSIPKKSGGTRTICTPISALKIIQTKLCQLLDVIYAPKPSTHGFVSSRSIVTNSSPHIKRRYVFNIDLQDFFPSINFGRVRGLFMHRPYELSSEAATTLARICCFNNQLPQGAPTSPVIANMICAKMDSQLQKLAKSQKCFYTRYADDITISTNLSAFPTAIATLNAINQVEVGAQLKDIIESNGFKINVKKVRLQQRKQCRQEVTGIIVNESPNLPRKYIRQIEAMLHAWQKYGLEKTQEEYWSKYDYRHRLPNKESVQFQHVVKGKIEFLGMIKGKSDPVYKRLYKW